jgi:hypothetical protein
MPCGSPGWQWVSCSPEGYVAELRWPDMGLAGSLPQEFGQLRSLKVLDLSRNKLSGTIPGAFGAGGTLWGLRELDLSRNMLTGALPAGMRGLTELQKLDLSFNTFVVSGCTRGCAVVAQGATTGFACTCRCLDACGNSYAPVPHILACWHMPSADTQGVAVLPALRRNLHATLRCFAGRPAQGVGPMHSRHAMHEPL